MVKARHIAPLLSLGGCLLAVAVAQTAPAGPPVPPQLHQALELLEQGQLAQAEAIAQTINEPLDEYPRAYAVLAAARQRQGKHEEAADAWRQYLLHCSDSAGRRYALAQLARCRPARDSQPIKAPSDRLDETQSRALAALSDQMHTVRSEHFVVKAANTLLAQLIADEAEVALRRIAHTLLGDQEYPHTVEIYVWPTARQFSANARSAPDWSGGSATYTVTRGHVVRRIDLTQLDRRGRLWKDMLDRVLPHELCHLVLREFFGDAAAPLALDEGLAMLAESTTHSQRLMQAGALAAQDDSMDIDTLLCLQRHQVDQPEEFYAMSFSLVEFLHHRLTSQQLSQMLTHIRDGATVSDALARCLYMAEPADFLTQIERAWRQHAQQNAQFLQALAER